MSGANVVGAANVVSAAKRMDLPPFPVPPRTRARLEREGYGALLTKTRGEFTKDVLDAYAACVARVKDPERRAELEAVLAQQRRDFAAVLELRAARRAGGDLR